VDGGRAAARIDFGKDLGTRDMILRARGGDVGDRDTKILPIFKTLGNDDLEIGVLEDIAVRDGGQRRVRALHSGSVDRPLR